LDQDKKKMRQDYFDAYKSGRRIAVNLSLLGICFSLFTFIIAINHTILKENFILALELTIAIPLLLSSLFSQTKLVHMKKPVMWEKFSYISFTLGYSFLISAIGILLSSLVDTKIGLTFLGANILMTLFYSSLKIIEDKSKLKSRLFKDLFFIIMLLIFGILPSLGILVWN
jgi:hypothetical protein